MRAKRLLRQTLVLVFAIALIFVGAALRGNAKVKADAFVHISGVVIMDGHDSDSIPGVAVTATAPGDSTVEFGPVTTDANGTYELDVTPGAYDFHFTPPTGSIFLPHVTNNVVALNDDFIPVRLARPTRIISGVITDAQGNPYPGLNVQFSEKNGSESSDGSIFTDIQGAYSATVPAGIYTLQINNPSGSASTFGLTASGVDGTTLTQADVTHSDDTTNNITMLGRATLSVAVKNADGSAASGAPVTYNAHESHTVPWLGGVADGTENGSITADDNGTASVCLFDGMQLDPGTLCTNQASTNTMICNTTPITLRAGQMSAAEIDLPGTHTISGTLLDGTGQPASNVTVSVATPSVTPPAFGFSPPQASTTTDASGIFSMQVYPTTYTLSLNKSSAAMQWSLTAHTSYDATHNDLHLALQLPPTGALNVSASSGASLSITGGAGTGITGGTDLYDTDFSSSHASLAPFVGTVFPVDSICASYSNPNGGSGLRRCNDSVITITSDTPAEVDLPSLPTRTFSGTITDSQGNPVANAGLNLLDDAVGYAQFGDTDAQGHFSFATYALTEGKLILFTDKTTVGANQIAYDVPDMASGDGTANYTVPGRQILTVTAKDSAGNPVSDQQVEYFAAEPGVIQPGVNPTLHTFLFGGQDTDENGQIKITALRDLTFDTSANDQGACTVFADGAEACNPTVITMNGDQSLILQEPAPIPAAPTSLTATTPTKNVPALSWTAAANADHYDIYRDGVKVSSTTTTSFTDSTAPEGTHTYYVKAVNVQGVSGDQSNVITVLYDKTAPTITYTLSPAANSAGWNNTNVTITFHCSDSGSGVAACSNPVTVSTESANRTVPGTTTDNAGNTASITATVNLDKTAPTASTVTLSTQLVIGSAQVTISATASDALSGATSGEFYIDTDPSQGHGTAMTFAAGKITAKPTISGLSLGNHTIFVRSKDKAGNWSTTVSKTFLYI